MCRAKSRCWSAGTSSQAGTSGSRSASRLPAGTNPHRHLALKARGAERVPAGIVPAAVFRQIRFLGLQRPVHGIVGDVKKERPARVLVADLGDEADRLFHPIVGRVVALGIGVDRRDGVVVDDARRKEIPGLAFEKPVETVKAAMGRPGRIGRCAVRRIVPLADRGGRVSGRAQGFGDRRRIERNVPEIAREARIVVGQPSGRHRMRVDPGQQGGARRRADRMRRIVAKPDAPAGQRIDVGGGDFRAVTADIGPTHIVHQDDHDIRRPWRRAHRQIPMRLRFLARSPDLAGKTRIAPWLAGNDTVLRCPPSPGMPVLTRDGPPVASLRQQDLIRAICAAGGASDRPLGSVGRP